MGSTLKGKNMLLKEQILSINSGPPLRREAKLQNRKWQSYFPWKYIQYLKVSNI